MQMQSQEIGYEDALKYLIRWMRAPVSSGYSSYGYDVFIPNVIRAYVEHELKKVHHEVDRLVRSLSPSFLAAAWDLSRRGVIRPGVKIHGAQATGEGEGFSFTPFGQTWLKESSKHDFVPTEPERFGQMLIPFRELFGPAYYQRAQEAVRCYGAHAFLACCAMCGAALESALLRLAIEKAGNEEVILKEYNSAGGRSKVENFLFGKARSILKQEFQGYSALLKYWRDTSAHGKATDISDSEAFTSLAILLRFSLFLKDHWNELKASGSGAGQPRG